MLLVGRHPATCLADELRVSHQRLQLLDVEMARAAGHCTATATQAANSETLGKIAVDLLGKTDVLPLTYNNYFVYSTTMLNGEVKSVGAFSKVWKWK